MPAPPQLDVASTGSATEPAAATATDLIAASPGRRAHGASVPDGHILAARYRVVRFISAGGMGEVYEVDDLLLDERVALKLLRPELSHKADAQARFAQEIRLARRVTHPNVCRVFDVGVDGERVFFTMELHPGETLAGLIRQAGPLAPATLRSLIAQLLAAVEAAHAAEVVHADLKPSNVLLASDGRRVVVTDFGLAMPCCAEFGCTCPMPHLLGTPAYMAPEQVNGTETLCERTDVYALGVMLYELVTGRLPFSGDNPRALAFARLDREPVPPIALRPGLDPRWSDAIAACLRRDPDERLGSVHALHAALGLDS